MSNSRRRILRFPGSSIRNGSQRQRQVERLRSRLDREQQALSRWLVRLKRAFHSFAKLQKSIARLERQLHHLEEG